MVSLLLCPFLGGGEEGGLTEGGGSSVAYYFAVEAWGGFESGGAADFYFGAKEHVGEDHEVGCPWDTGESGCGGGGDMAADDE